MQVENECCGNLWHAGGQIPNRGNAAASGVRESTWEAGYPPLVMRCCSVSLLGVEEQEGGRREGKWGRSRFKGR